MISLLLGGCDALGMRRGVSSSARSGIKVIVVASTLGKVFRGTSTGTTVFNNTTYEQGVSGWKIDELAAQIGASYIAKDLGLSAKAIESIFGDRTLDTMLSTARGQGADALVVIEPAGSQNHPDFAPGYGFHRRTLLGMSKQCIYSLLIVRTYSVPTGKELGWQWGHDEMNSIPCYGAGRNIPWKDQFGDFSAEEKEALRQSVVESLSANIPYGLKALGLSSDS